MTRIFLSGHRNFGNRGCEAIVRSTVGIVRRAIQHAEFMVPSTNIERDKALWPDAYSHGVGFYSCIGQSVSMRAYSKARRKFRWLNNIYPPVGLSVEARRLIDASDVVLSVGGDNYSEDYALPFLPLLMDHYAMSRGKPVILWGASVGPFETDARYKSFMARHMQRYAAVFVRERHSESYCREQLGVNRVLRFADPAFALASESPKDGPGDSHGSIGVNISPLVLSKLGPRADAFVDAIANALFALHCEYGADVLLIPHVMAYTGPNDDRIALETLARRLEASGVPVWFAPGTLNAAEIKFLISECRVLIGARTHATIAAMSMGVPVVSIGYSVKATGVNEMVFGDARHVMDFRRLEDDALVDHVRAAIADSETRTGARDELRRSAESAGEALCDLLIGELGTLVSPSQHAGG